MWGRVQIIPQNMVRCVQYICQVYICMFTKQRRVMGIRTVYTYVQPLMNNKVPRVCILNQVSQVQTNKAGANLKQSTQLTNPANCLPNLGICESKDVKSPETKQIVQNLYHNY